MVRFAVEIDARAVEELRKSPAAARSRVLSEIEKQLPGQADIETKHRKPLPGVARGFFHVPPIWQLSVADYRIFYDIDAEAAKVFVRAIRLKGKRTTEEII